MTAPGRTELRARHLELAHDRYLDDHRIDGRPVLPFAVAMELMAEAARRRARRAGSPGCGGSGCWTGSRRRDGTELSGHASAPKLEDRRRRGADRAATARRTIASLVAVPRAAAGERRAAAAARLAAPRRSRCRVEEAYRELLFHGPLFQGIAADRRARRPRRERGPDAPSQPGRCVAGADGAALAARSGADRQRPAGAGPLGAAAVGRDAAAGRDRRLRRGGRAGAGRAGPPRAADPAGEQRADVPRRPLVLRRGRTPARDPRGRRRGRHEGAQPARGSASREREATGARDRDHGMACLFPGAPDLDAYWRNILGKVDAISEPPPEAWDPDVYYDPEFADDDRPTASAAATSGELADVRPARPRRSRRSRSGASPTSGWRCRSPATRWPTRARASCPTRSVPRTAIILGKGTYLNGGNAIAVQRGLVVGQTIELLRRLHPEHSERGTGASCARSCRRSCPPLGPETVPGLIPNIIVGRIANRLDLMGPAYTVDAACASSLVAIAARRPRPARRRLRPGAGGRLAGVDARGDAEPVLPARRAVAPASSCAAFDSDADGTLLGEGIGMVVLKRARGRDARRRPGVRGDPRRRRRQRRPRA